jgi:hypothetical protein
VLIVFAALLLLVTGAVAGILITQDDDSPVSTGGERGDLGPP